KERDIKTIVDSKPEVIAHNIETVERLTPMVRDRRAKYHQSLKVLQTIKTLDSQTYTKSSIMLGFNETEEEVVQTMKDLREVGVDFLTLGQYMRPTLRHLPVKRYLAEQEFVKYKKLAEGLGFLSVASGPLIRSSYKAGEVFMNGVIENHRRKLVN
ncbi:MAG: lipoyl synthase, partial [Candidatus Heimdallarchaeota archaeon]|nr:lipoyl synthase [Candidatus Heimdallarchaeota archaeon]